MDAPEPWSPLPIDTWTTITRLITPQLHMPAAPILYLATATVLQASYLQRTTPFSKATVVTLTPCRWPFFLHIVKLYLGCASCFRSVYFSHPSPPKPSYG